VGAESVRSSGGSVGAASTSTGGVSARDNRKWRPPASIGAGSGRVARKASSGGRAAATAPFVPTFAQRMESARSYIDRVCGDTWCEGEYSWRFEPIKCDDRACTMEISGTTRSDEDPQTVSGICQLTREAVEDGRHETLVEEVSHCIDRIEGSKAVPAPIADGQTAGTATSVTGERESAASVGRTAGGESGAGGNGGGPERTGAAPRPTTLARLVPQTPSNWFEFVNEREQLELESCLRGVGALPPNVLTLAIHFTRNTVKPVFLPEQWPAALSCFERLYPNGQHRLQITESVTVEFTLEPAR
jgi:hypothetical protein